jgi:hypothetical protein
MGLALVRAKEELPRWGRPTLKFRDTANPDAEPFFVLDDKDKVQHWEYVEGLRKHSVQSLRMVTDTLVRHMSRAFKERSCRKSLFIRHESGVWAALPHQRALVEEANKRLS